MLRKGACTRPRAMPVVTPVHNSEHPIQQHAYPTVYLRLVEAGDKQGTMLAPQLCGHGDGCDVAVDGWKPSGVVLGLAGVNPLQQRRYRCKTHNRVFTAFDAAFCEAAYQPSTGFSWNDMQLEPMIVKHGQTYMTAELLWDIISMFENRNTVKQIVDILQQRWAGIYAQHVHDFVMQSQLAVSYQPWWEEHFGHKLFTDRRKVYSVIAAYFNTFLRPRWEAGVLFARRFLCYGISIDETFKLALKCSVKTVDDAGRIKYKSAPYAVHTVFSSVTQMAVGFRFMPNKTNVEKAVLVRDIFEDQAQYGDAAVITRFVATDSPLQDKSMLVEVHQSVFGNVQGAQSAVAGQVDAGDDLWHVYHRIGKHLTYNCSRLKPSLLALLKRGTDCAPTPAGMDVAHYQTVCAAKLVHDLEVWLSQHRPNGRAVEQVNICMQRLDTLFTFLPHSDKLVRCGTTANEHGNWALNRRCKFVAHMRPDHTRLLVQYTLYILNSMAATKCGSLTQLPEDVRAKAQHLFARPKGIDFHAVAAAGRAPYLLPYLPPQREYSLAQYEEEFGAAKAGA